MDAAWDRLYAGWPSIPRALESYAPLLPALAVHIASSWMEAPTPLLSTAAAWDYELQYEDGKLASEVALSA